MTDTKKYSLLNNARFYILAFSVLLSIMSAAWFKLEIQSPQLYYIRLEQFYGLLSILFWYVALIISPLGYTIGKHRLKYLIFSRRAIGVSAAYFALLHVLVALYGQLGGLSQTVYLPGLFKLSLIGGAFALFVLLIMAATSFDRVITYMTFMRWKWLHRLVYMAGVIAVLHIWSIGTHVAYSGVQIAAFAGLAVLGGLEIFRVLSLFTRKYTSLQPKEYFIGMFLAVWLVWLLLVMSLPSIVRNYHSDHKGENHTSWVASEQPA